MNDAGQDVTPLTRNTWPPSPAIQPGPVQTKIVLDWFRPALWFGVAFNILACMPAIDLPKYPAGCEMMDDHIHGSSWVAIATAAVSTLLIGVPIAVWQMRVRLGSGASLTWEWAGLALCLTPFPIGVSVLSFIVNAKAFKSV